MQKNKSEKEILGNVAVTIIKNRSIDKSVKEKKITSIEIMYIMIHTGSSKSTNSLFWMQMYRSL